MRTDLERDDFITLLERINSEDEAEILAAVRDINAKMTVAGVTWDDLLMSQDTASADQFDEDDDDDDDDDEEDDDVGDNDNDDPSTDQDDDGDLEPLSDAEKQEATSLISAIGSLEISDATKQELEEYAEDLKEGEFGQMDLRYLRALKARLSA